MEFKTPRNKTNGSRRYLAIDTESHTFSRRCRTMITPGIEIKVKDYKELVEKLTEFYGFTESEDCIC